MKNTLPFFILLFVNNIYAQTDSLKKISYTAYGELYYSYDFSNPSNHEKPNFIYNHKRHNELNANLLLVKANFLDKNYRACLGLMTGNYAQYNLSSEPTWAQFIYEANVGFKLSNKKNIWMDAGIMPSHIGFESAIGADCWTLTRGLLAENSPYYETGIKISNTTSNKKLYVAAMFLNGWQKISKPNFMQKPSFGMQATYKPNSNLTINYSNFLGTDKPDSLKSFRHFHNFYLQYDATKNFGIIAGFDIGFEKILHYKYNNWYTPIIMIRKKVDKNVFAALRAEYYADRNQVIVTTGTTNGFEVFGLSANMDLDINAQIKWRLEGKMYNSKDKIFEAQARNSNYAITTNLAIKF